MAMLKLLSAFFLQLVLVLFVAELAKGQRLSLGFYEKTCPSLQKIVKKTTAGFISRAPSLAATLLRTQFHDCFVRGCDASVLLHSTKNNQAEKDARPNQSLRGYHVIDAVKSAVEKKCPGVVSCADILALVARDAVSLIKGPSWPVTLGRRDGRVSKASDALNNLPPPTSNITRLKEAFHSRGLNATDLAVLAGAHTIGIAHCRPFINRLYNFTGKGDADPNMDQNYIAALKRRCAPGDNTTIVEMDPGSAKTFDSDYFILVTKRRGLFQSDAALLDDSVTKAYVQRQAKSYGANFFDDFAASMLKMGQIGVLTGKAGEIRKQCGFVN